jgi:hypothetical protein
LLLAVTVIGNTVILVAPLLLFTPRLLAAKHRGLREYGRLAAAYTRAFDVKWLRTESGPAEPLLGSADVQSLPRSAKPRGSTLRRSRPSRRRLKGVSMLLAILDNGHGFATKALFALIRRSRFRYPTPSTRAPSSSSCRVPRPSRPVRSSCSCAATVDHGIAVNRQTLLIADPLCGAVRRTVRRRIRTLRACRGCGLRPPSDASARTRLRGELVKRPHWEPPAM